MTHQRARLVDDGNVIDFGDDLDAKWRLACKLRLLMGRRGFTLRDLQLRSGLSDSYLKTWFEYDRDSLTFTGQTNRRTRLSMVYRLIRIVTDADPRQIVSQELGLRPNGSQHNRAMVHLIARPDHRPGTVDHPPAPQAPVSPPPPPPPPKKQRIDPMLEQQLMADERNRQLKASETEALTAKVAALRAAGISDELIAKAVLAG